jgi:hypothetical protein
MKAQYNPYTNEYLLIVNKDDLFTAFISKDCLNSFMHDAVLCTMSEKVADELFPIKKGDNDEDV